MTDKETPVEQWADACEKATRNVEMARFEDQADVAIGEAHLLLAVAHRLKGVACPVCNGEGYRAYGSTATWQGGIGGAMVTTDICDKCWGTGRTDRTGPDLRKLRALYHI